MIDDSKVTKYELLSVKQVAENLGCSIANVYALVDRGAIPVVRIGRSKGYRITARDLAAFIESRREQYEATTAEKPSRPRLKHLKL